MELFLQEIRVWDPNQGNMLGKALKGHTGFITNIAWEPIHLAQQQRSRFATASKDSTVRIWDAKACTCILTISGHTAAVMSLRWCGDGLLCTASQDKTVKVWEAATGKQIRTLNVHGHWVNHLSLSTDHVLRNAPPTAEDGERLCFSFH